MGAASRRQKHSQLLNPVREQSAQTKSGHTERSQRHLRLFHRTESARKRVRCSLAGTQRTSEHSRVSRATPRLAPHTTARGHGKRHMQLRLWRRRSHVPSPGLRKLRRSASASVLCTLPTLTKLGDGKRRLSYISQSPIATQTYSSSPRWPWPGSPPHSRLETSPPGRGRCPPRNPLLRCSELDRGRERERVWKVGRRQ